MPVPAPIQQFIDGLSERAPAQYGDLRAIPRRIFEQVGVRVDEVRTADRAIPPGVYPDMTEQGYDTDEFPEIYRSLVAPADIIILAGPIWLGDQSSLTGSSWSDSTRTPARRMSTGSGRTTARSAAR